MKVPKDISKYKTTIIGNFTIRQVVCAVIAGILDFLVYFFIVKDSHIPQRSLIFIFTFVSLLPMVFVLEIEGLKFEVYLKNVLWRSFIWPRYRLQNNEIIPLPKETMLENDKKKRKKEVEKLIKENPEMKAYD